MLLLIAGLALGALSTVGRKSPADARGTVLVLMGASLVTGCVLLGMDGGPLSAFLPFLVIRLAVALVLPAAVFLALTVPDPVREYLAANPRTPRPGDGAAAYRWSPRPERVHASRPAPAPAQQSYPTAVSGHEAAYPPAPQAAQPPAQSSPTAPGLAPDASGYGMVPTDGASPVQPAGVASEQETTVIPAATDTDIGAPEAHEIVSPTEKVALSDPIDQLGREEGGFTWAQAADPTTPAATLAQIVQDAPSLRAAVASNPTTYPALLEWLAQLGDPEVDAALAARVN